MRHLLGALCAGLLGFGLSLGGCARSMPPSGGPPDTTPPVVIETVPGRKASSVLPDTRLELVFSEDVECRTVARSITIMPDVPLGDTDCRGERFSARFSEDLQSEQTYVVTVEPGIEDKHRVRSRKSYVFAFSTGDSLDQGSIHGKVMQDTVAIGGAVIWAGESRVNPDSLGVIRDWDYMATSGEGGSFILEYLKPGGYHLVAFIDRNSNGRFETESEQGLVTDEIYTIRSRRDRVEGLVLRIPLPEKDEEQDE